MILDERQLLATLHYQLGLSDMVTAMYLDARARNDFKLFALTAEGYFSEISRLNCELRAYLDAHRETALQPMPAVTEPEQAA